MYGHKALSESESDIGGARAHVIGTVQARGSGTAACARARARTRTCARWLQLLARDILRPVIRCRKLGARPLAGTREKLSRRTVKHEQERFATGRARKLSLYPGAATAWGAATRAAWSLAYWGRANSSDLMAASLALEAWRSAAEERARLTCWPAAFLAARAAWAASSVLRTTAA